MILGICGYSKVGKNTVCEGLPDYEQHAFADVLKQQVTTMLKANHIEVDVWGKDKEAWRDFLVFWGRKMRSLDIHYWVKHLYELIAPLGDKQICITDVRYLSEVRWIQDKGGIVVMIDRPGYGPANEEEAASIREIEVQIPKLPRVINDGTPKLLTKRVMAAVKQAALTPEIPLERLNRWLAELGEFEEMRPPEAAVLWGITLREAKERLHMMIGDLLVIPPKRVEVYVYGEGADPISANRAEDPTKVRYHRLSVISGTGSTSKELACTWNWPLYSTNKYLAVLLKEKMIEAIGNARFKIWVLSKKGKAWLTRKV